MFRPSVFSLDDNKKMCDSFFEYVDILTDNIKFILTYKSNSLPDTLKEMLHNWIVENQIREVFFIKLISHSNKENIQYTVKGLLNDDADSVTKREIEKYFLWIDWVRHWIFNFEKECDNLLSDQPTKR